MAKEWILNSAMSRFQLNYKRNVGATSENIRKCAPKSLEEWESYYFENVKSRAHIKALGKKLYIKVTETLQAEIEKITEKDCIEYMFGMVINRTYDGYVTEITTIYGQLQKEITDTYEIQPAPDKWDRLYNVDFYIQVENSYVGIQIKPVDKNIQLAQIFKEKSIQENTHKKFTAAYNGKVFYVYSKTIHKKKEIVNKEVIAQIKTEIKRLEKK